MDLSSNPDREDRDRFVGKIISQKPIKMNVINSVLYQAWARYNAVRISETALGILLFDFEKEDDRDRIIDMSP